MVLLGKCVDGKQDYQKHVDVSVAERKNPKKPTTFQVTQTLRDFCLTCLTLNLIVYNKTMWCFYKAFNMQNIPLFQKVNRCLRKLIKKISQVFNCDYSQILLIVLKLVPAIFIKFLFFHQMIALPKLSKKLFISSKKLFSFPRYLIFCISVLSSFSSCRPLLQRMIEDNLKVHDVTKCLNKSSITHFF